MNEELALSVLARLRVARTDGRGRRHLHTGELLRVARAWAHASFDSVAFVPTRICNAEQPQAVPRSMPPEPTVPVTPPTPLASGAHGPNPPPAVPAAPVLPHAPPTPHGGATASALALNQSWRLLASGGWDRTIRLWRLAGSGEDEAFLKLTDLRGHQGVILGLTWATVAEDKHFLISCSNDGRVICWEVVRSGASVRRSAFSARAIWSWKGLDAGAQVSSITAARTPQGHWLLSAVKQNGLVMLWDRDIWTPGSPWPGGSQAVVAVGDLPMKPPNAVVKTPFFLGVRNAVLHPRGEAILVAGNDKMFKGWVLALPITRADGEEDFRIAETPRKMQGQHEGGVRCMSVSQCGDFVLSGAFGSRENILVHRVADGTLQQSLAGHESGVAAMALEGQFLVTAGDDGSLRIWRWVLGKCLKVLHGNANAPLAQRLKAVAFDIEGDQVRIIGATEKTKQEPGQLLLWADA